MLGAALGALVPVLAGRGGAADAVAGLLSAPGRRLAAAWLLGLGARTAPGAVLAAGAFVAAMLVAGEVVPPSGVEAAVREAGLPQEEATSLAAQLDRSDGGIDAVLIAAGLLLGAGAAAWRSARPGVRAAGMALLAGALLRDGVAGVSLLEPTALAAVRGPYLEGSVRLAEVVLALVLLARLALPARGRVAALAAALLVAAALVVLPAAPFSPHAEIVIIR